MAAELHTELKNAICEAIAQVTPFTFDQISKAHDRLGSFDLVISACKYAMTSGLGFERAAAFIDDFGRTHRSQP